MPRPGAERAFAVALAALVIAVSGCHRDRPTPSAPRFRLAVITGPAPAVSAAARQLGLGAPAARVRACRLALLARALDAASIAKLSDALDQLHEEAQPLALDLDEASAAHALAAWQHDHVDAWSAVAFLSEPSWGSPDGTFRAAAVDACPAAPAAAAEFRCAAPASPDPRVRHAALLAWPLVDAVLVECAAPRCPSAVTALRQRAREPGAVVGTVLSPVAADVSRLRRSVAALAPLARRGRTPLATLVDGLDAEPDPSACSGVVRDTAQAILVAPKLSMLVHAMRMRAEVDAALAGTGARVSPRGL